MDSNTYASGSKDSRQISRGISGSTLKLIAIFTMLIDHIGAAILEKMLVERGLNDLAAGDVQAAQTFFAENGTLFVIYSSMRLIGRIAFPIFCFLLIEGFLHTSNIQKYASRLAVFALFSEIPFDLAFSGKLLSNGHQNVFITLFIGLMVLFGFKLVEDVLINKKYIAVLSVIGAILVGCALSYVVNGFAQAFMKDGERSLDIMNLFTLAGVFSIVALLIYTWMCKKNSVQRASVRFTDLAVLFAGMLLAELLRADYAGFGILTIAIMYGLRRSRIKSMLSGCITLTVMSFSEFSAFLNLPLIYFYNGKRGLKLKYIFYLFYPVHLLILYFICYFMKLI